MRLFSLLAGVMVCASAFGQTASAAAAPGPVPLEFFTKWDEFGGVKISPDGEFIAALTGKYGRSMLVFQDLKNRKTVATVGVPDNCEIDDYEWVSPTRLIYTIAQRWPGEVQPIPTGEIRGINRDGSGLREVYGYRAGESSMDTHIARRKSSYAEPRLLSTLKKDPDHILIAEYPWRKISTGWAFDPDAKPLVTRVDVYSGKKQKIDAVPLMQARVLLDRDDNVRFAYGRNLAQQHAISWKPKVDGEWESFDLKGFREDSVFPRRLSSDNRSVYVTGVREGEQYKALYRVDLQTQQVEKVHAFADTDVRGIIPDFTDNEIIGVSGYSERATNFWLLKDNPAAQTFQALERAFPNQNARVTSTSDDGRLVVLFVESDVNPGDYYLFDTVTKHADFLRAGRVWIEPKQMRPKEPIALKARDGLELHGYVTRAAGDGPHPLVVLPHGGPHAVRDTWEFDWEVQLLASRGYSVLQVNFRGSGGYGMDFEQAGFREWGAKMQDDLTDATRWAIEQKIAPADRICIYGASYGGYAALMGVEREPDLYRCAIGYAGVYDLQLILEAADAGDSSVTRTYFERVLGSDAAKLRAQSPVANAQNIKVPVLLIHGKADNTADYEHAKRMRAALEQSQKKYEWLALGGEGHGIYDEGTRREVYERILQFLDANLMKAPTASQ